MPESLPIQLIARLEAYALEHNVMVLRLQTGICPTEAIHLYQQLGYLEIPPFGQYRDNPFNRFY